MKTWQGEVVMGFSQTTVLKKQCCNGGIQIGERTLSFKQDVVIWGKEFDHTFNLHNATF